MNFEQKTLIYIEEDNKTHASKFTKGFAVKDTRNRVYINALASELAMKYLAQEGINLSNISNLHNIHKLREEFDIADIMLPNIHIDVRMIYDENLIFVPKSHFEYNLVPDIYLVLQMAEDANFVKFLGFFEPKLINKNNENSDYYFIEKEKLSDPSDLKSYINGFNGNTTQTLPEIEKNEAKRLALDLIDHDITTADKKNLINMLAKSSLLREDLTEFDKFEWASYHVATDEELLQASDIAFSELPLENESGDEFDTFENNDEFNNFKDDDLTENFGLDILLEDEFSEDSEADEPDNIVSEEQNLADDEESFSEEKFLEPVDEIDINPDSFDNLETFENKPLENLFEETEISPFEEFEPAQEEIPVQEIETTLFDDIDSPAESTETEEIASFEEDEKDEETEEIASFEEDEKDEETEEIVSFEELQTIEQNESNDTEEETETVSLEELSTSTTTPTEEDIEPVAIGNVTETNSPQEGFDVQETTIDTNLNSDEDSIELDDIEKLGVLYDQNNNLYDVDTNLEIKTTSPEKGKKAILLATAIVATLASLLIYASFNKLNNQDKNSQANTSGVLENNIPNIEEQPIPGEMENIMPARMVDKPKLDDMAKEAEKHVIKANKPAMESPYIEVKKLSWEVPDYVSYNDSFKKYLQTAGKSLKLSLSSDLLLATEYAYSNQMKLDITVAKEGTIQDAKIVQSSGSTQIDNIVLRTVKDTLNVVKAPPSVIVGNNIHVALKIYL